MCSRQQRSTADRSPFVLADVGPDGQPQAMLVTPATETIVDRETARSLIAELLTVVSPAPSAVASAGTAAAAALVWVAGTGLLNVLPGSGCGPC